MNAISPESIRTRPRTSCYLCGSSGDVVYAERKDVRYDCPGIWNIRRCSSKCCDLLWLDPVPVDDDLHLLYRYFRETHQDPVAKRPRFLARIRGTSTRGYLTARYNYPVGGNSQPSHHKLRAIIAYLRPIHRAEVDFPFEQLSNLPKGRLLDVGCGGGGTMKLMKEWGWQVEGIDFDPTAIENAKRKDLAVHLGSLSDQGFADNSFDAIIMSHVIEHVPQPIEFLIEVHRILRPGGRVVVATPNAWSLGHRLWRGAWISLATPYHLFIFSRSSLHSAMVRAGFTPISLRTTPRWSRESFKASLSIYRSGWLREGIPTSLSFRLFGSFMARLEWASLLFRKNLGEEIVAVGTK